MFCEQYVKKNLNPTDKRGLTIPAVIFPVSCICPFFSCFHIETIVRIISSLCNYKPGVLLPCSLSFDFIIHPRGDDLMQRCKDLCPVSWLFSSLIIIRIRTEWWCTALGNWASVDVHPSVLGYHHCTFGFHLGWCNDSVYIADRNTSIWKV